ncbi:MAG TPA: flagellar hook-basal body complex protein FliE [bacterium]|nr:flagellar hook-basal body complex protein FliE [bacterium]HPN43166.1 flagellar hook-basal body complex protein FliE [bacterium]
MSSIPSITGQNYLPEVNIRPGSTDKKDTSFGDRVKELLGDVNNMQLDAGKVADQFAKGEVEDIHDVMIAAEKASVGLELVLQVRNRLIDAYREISRMQM